MALIAVVAGEPSGDRLGAAMMREIKAKRPSARFIGIGGDAMQDVGMEAIGHSDTLTLMGLDGLATKLSRIWALRKQLLRRLEAERPDIFIGIDAPDFNLAVEKRLKKQGIKTGHYVAPSVWAWRAYRLPKIQEATHFLMGIYPFEEAWFGERGIDLSYVGHPMLDELAALPSQSVLRSQIAIETQDQVVAVLIGSRRGEIKRMARTLTNIANQLNKKGYKVFIPMVSDAKAAFFRQISPEINPAINISVGNSREILALADFAIVKSGTSSLEAALLGTPHIVVYRASWFSYQWAKRQAVRAEVSMPNIMLNQRIVPELLQQEMTEENIARAFYSLVEEKQANAQRQAFSLMRDNMIHKRQQGAADIVLQQLDGR